MKTKIKKAVASLAAMIAVAVGAVAATAAPAEAALYETPYIQVTCSSVDYVRFRLSNGDTNWVWPCTTERHQVTAVYNYLGQGGKCWNALSGVTLATWGAGSGWVSLPSIVRASGYHLACRVWY